MKTSNQTKAFFVLTLFLFSFAQLTATPTTDSGYPKTMLQIRALQADIDRVEKYYQQTLEELTPTRKEEFLTELRNLNQECEFFSKNPEKLTYELHHQLCTSILNIDGTLLKMSPFYRRAILLAPHFMPHLLLLIIFLLLLFFATKRRARNKNLEQELELLKQKVSQSTKAQ